MMGYSVGSLVAVLACIAMVHSQPGRPLGQPGPMGPIGPNNPMNPPLPPVNNLQPRPGMGGQPIMPSPSRPFIPSLTPRPDTIADKIVRDPNLSEIVGFLRRVDLLKSLNATSFVSTVFLPDNAAIADATIPSASLDLLRFVEYHYVAGNVTTDKMQPNGHKWTLNGTYFNGSSVWFQIKQEPNGRTQYSVNGAQVISPDNMAANGVYHVIDRALQPIGSLKSLSEYMKTESGYMIMSDMLRDTRTMALDKQLSNETVVWTVFAPLDNAVPDFRLQERNPLEMLSRHVVRGRVLFDDCIEEMTSVRAVTGDIKIVREAQKVYVQNGEGERAEIIRFNQPTENGVIHRISDVLGYAWRTLLQTIDMRDTLATLRKHITRARLNTELDRRDVNLTLFAPTNDAFMVFMRNKQLTHVQMARLVKSHIADQTVTSLDVGDGSSDVIMNTLVEDEIRFTRNRADNELVVKYRGHTAKVIAADIRTSNGVMHIIDRVLDGSTSDAVAFTSVPVLALVLISMIAM